MNRKKKWHPCLTPPNKMDIMLVIRMCTQHSKSIRGKMHVRCQYKLLVLTSGNWLDIEEMYGLSLEHSKKDR